MKSAVAFLALVAAASAQTWPMVTVDTAGNIVLQSTTKTRSFKLITTAVTAAGTAQASATAIPAGTSHATITASATTNGVALPAAEAGFRVTLVKATSTAAFSVYAASGDQINSAATSAAWTVSATDLLTTCEAFDATNWLCESRDKYGGASGSVFVTSASLAPPSATAPKRIGDLYVDTANKNVYFAKGTTNGLDYVMISKASATPQIKTGTVRPGSGTVTSTTGYGKPAKIGDLYADTTNTGLYIARGSTNGYDWARVAAIFRSSTSVYSALMGKNLAKSTVGDIVTNSFQASKDRIVIRLPGSDVTGSIGSAGTFTSILS
jgi:hypothetical protein